jgi:hypothetical protein
MRIFIKKFLQKNRAKHKNFHKPGRVDIRGGNKRLESIEKLGCQRFFVYKVVL